MYSILRMFHWKCCYKIFRTRTMFTFLFTQTHTQCNGNKQSVLLMMISFLRCKLYLRFFCLFLFSLLYLGKKKEKSTLFWCVRVEKKNSLFIKINNESGWSTRWTGNIWIFFRKKEVKKNVLFCLTLYLMKVYSHLLIARIQNLNPSIHHHSYSCRGFYVMPSFGNDIILLIGLQNNIDEILKAIVLKKVNKKNNTQS